MKKISPMLIIFAALLVSVCVAESCVPKRKFAEQKRLLDKFEDENDSLISANEQLIVSNTELRSQMERIRQHIQQMKADSVELAKNIADLRDINRKLENKLQETVFALQSLKKGSEQQASKLTMQIEGIQNDLQQREAELQRLSNELEEKRRNLAAMEQELAQRNRRMAELERIVMRQDSAVKALRNKVSAALVGLENNGLTISIREGKVYVSLDEKLLFKSGSIAVDPAGVNALKKLVKVLEQNPDINITIEGHTDNVPLASNASMADNWDLSVKRATSIVRILLDNTKIKPERLTAAGRGEFIPVDAANTSGARQKNRRTEIILMPKLDELYKILE
ncbi:MAG: OmpA family protein [Bacteroidales bacterium]|jgi:chemotaxis protein MotB|nr:OmpA family protein [Bacteroidales bacterium]